MTNNPQHSLDQARSHLLDLCERVLRAELTLEEFYSVEPARGADPLLDLVADDLEDAIEHMPGKAFSREVKMESWIDSEAYLTVYLDRAILQMRDSSQALLDLRSRVLKLEPLSRRLIDRETRQ